MTPLTSKNDGVSSLWEKFPAAVFGGFKGFQNICPRKKWAIGH